MGVWFENRIYRHELTAIGVVASLAGSEMDPAATLELIPQSRGVPILSVTAPAGSWTRFLRGELTADMFRDMLVIRIGTRADGSSLSRPTAGNSSYWRTDVAVRPLFDFQLGQGTDAFLYTLRVAPEAIMTPFRGGIVTLQAGIRIHDDRDPCGDADPCGLPVIPIRNTLSWGSWLPGQWLWAASGGIFPGDRYGFLAEVGRLYLDGHLEVWAGGEAHGRDPVSRGSGPVLEHRAVGRVRGGHPSAPNGLDLEGTVQVGRFREEELGVRVELARRMEEFEIGFFGVANQFDEVAGVTPSHPAPPCARTHVLPGCVWPRFPRSPFTYRESVSPVAVQTSLYDNLDRFRKRLYPTYNPQQPGGPPVGGAVPGPGRMNMAGKTLILALYLTTLFAPAARAETEFLENFTLSGTSGVVNTPVASVLASGTIGFGFSLIDEQWAYNARGRTDNNHYFLTVGFLPRVELSVRASYFPQGEAVHRGRRGRDRGPGSKRTDPAPYRGRPAPRPGHRRRGHPRDPGGSTPSMP